MSDSLPRVLELQPGSMAVIGEARRFVRRALDGEVPESVSSDLELVTSELVTNALEHGERVPVVIKVRVDARRAWVSIETQGGFPAGAIETDQWTIAPADHPTGRGLGIVRAIADDVYVATRGSHVTITVHRNLSD